MTAPSYVNGGSLSGALSAGGGTPALPGSRANGNVLVAWIWGDTGGANVSLDAGSLSNGWTLGVNVNSANGSSGWAWRLVDGAESAPVFVFSVTQFAAHWQCDQFTGNHPTTPIGASTSANGNSSSLVAGQVVTTGDDSMILGHMMCNGASTAPATPASFTSLDTYADGFGASRTVSEAVATSGSTSDACTGSLSASTTWIGHVIEIISPGSTAGGGSTGTGAAAAAGASVAAATGAATASGGSGGVAFVPEPGDGGAASLASL